MADNTVKTVDRIAAILRALADTRFGAGLPLAELAAETGLAKPTAHRLLGALGSVGFTFQDLDSRRYRLGSGAAAIGRAAQRQYLSALASPALARLAEATGDTAFASVIEGSASVCIARAVGSFPIRTLTLEVGSRRPLGVGAGSLALMAALADPEIDRAIALNRDWLVDFAGFAPEDLPELVARTRRDGYARNEGRIVEAMNAVAVAACDEAGRPFLALSLAAIRDRMGETRLPELVRLLRDEARRLEELHALGEAKK